METLVFSDTHLTTKFSENKYRFLFDIIERSDRVVINGDFWDGYKISFDAFITSEWSRLFPLLKSKNTVYIWGNHDHRDRTDKRVYRFCDSYVEQYEMEVTGVRYLIQHGHSIDWLFGSINPFWLFKSVTKLYDLIDERLGWLTFDKGLVNLIHKRHVKRNISDGQVLVCGHSHKALFEPQRGYVNLGRVTSSKATYAVITEQDGLTLYTETY